MVSLRRYLVMAILTGIIVFAISALFGTSIAGFLVAARDQALGAGMGILASIIADPLIWGATNPVPGALAAAVLWPVLLIWLALVFIMVLLGFGAAGIQDVDSRVSLFLS